MVLNSLVTAEVNVPESVKCTVKARKVTITGPLGVLKRDFDHATLQLRLFVNHKGEKRIRVGLWNGNKKQNAVVKTICSEIENLIKGVQFGFKFEMKFVYAHFPINCNISNDKKTIEIRNYIGSRNHLVVKMLQGCTVARSEEKDTIIIEGIDLDKVSQSAASIQQICQVKNKDIRKFLDGVYVSNRGVMVEAE
jgi:large subunit ribosomal protein L9e